MRKMRTWRECLIEQLADRKSAIAYLQAILEELPNLQELYCGSEIASDCC